VVRPPSGLLAVHVSAEREQEEHQRERVLGLGDPGDRFNGKGMQREYERRQPCPTQAQLPQHAPDKKCAEQMQGQANDVVGEGMVAPEAPFGPEDRQGQRPVVVRRRGEPDAPKTVEASQIRILGDKAYVVPKPAAMHGRPIDPKPHYRYD
jgi:hypothetical protein